MTTTEHPSVDMRTMPLSDLSAAIATKRQQLNDILYRLSVKQKELRQRFGRIDQAIARDASLVNDWKRRDKQMEMREADEALQRLLVEETELIKSERELKTSLELMRSIRINRIVEMLSNGLGELLAPLLASPTLATELN